MNFCFYTTKEVYMCGMSTNRNTLTYKLCYLINNCLALNNLLGQTNKRYRVYTHCLDYTKSIRLKICQKVVYIGHHLIIPVRHAIQRKGKYFKGQVDHMLKPLHYSGQDVFGMVKDVKGLFGKEPKENPIRMMLTNTHPSGRRRREGNQV